MAILESERQEFVANVGVATVLLNAKTLVVLRPKQPNKQDYFWLVRFSIPCLRLKDDQRVIDIKPLVKGEIRLLKDQATIHFDIKPEDLKPLFDDLGIGLHSITSFNIMFTTRNREAIIWFKDSANPNDDPNGIVMSWEARSR